MRPALHIVTPLTPVPSMTIRVSRGERIQPTKKTSSDLHWRIKILGQEQHSGNVKSLNANTLLYQVYIILVIY